MVHWRILRANTGRKSSPKKSGCSRPCANSVAPECAARCKAGSGPSRTALKSQHPRDPLDAFIEVFQGARVGKAHVTLRVVRPEVEPRRNCNARFFQHPQCELGAVLGETLASGVDVKGSLGHHGDAKSQLAE